MKKYNLFVLLNNTTDEEINKTNQAVLELIKKNNGEVVAEEKMGKRKLAFPIKKVRHGFYFNYVVDMSAVEFNLMGKVWQELKSLPDVLRIEISNCEETKAGIKKNYIHYEEAGERENFVNKEETKTEIESKPQVVEEVVVEKKKKENKISMEDLDKKLDDILESEEV